MLNTERIRLMTRLAAYEQGEGKEYMPMSQYYRRDYVGIQMIKTFLYSTVAFCLLVVLSVLYQIDDLEKMLYQMDYYELAKGFVVKYILFVVLYQVIACVVANLRYRRGHKKQKLYYSRLKKVEKLYEREEKMPPVD